MRCLASCNTTSWQRPGDLFHTFSPTSGSPHSTKVPYCTQKQVEFATAVLPRRASMVGKCRIYYNHAIQRLSTSHTWKGRLYLGTGFLNIWSLALPNRHDLLLFLFHARLHLREILQHKSKYQLSRNLLKACSIAREVRYKGLPPCFEIPSPSVESFLLNFAGRT